MTNTRVKETAESARRELGPDGRPFTESEFFAICEERGISVHLPRTIRGFDAAFPRLASVPGFSTTTEHGPLIVVLSLF